MGQVQLRRIFSGVQASEATRKISAIAPKRLSASEIGLAPRSPWAAWAITAAPGRNAPAMTPGLSQGRGAAMSVVLSEIHTGVQAGHLVRVAVEGEGRAAAPLAQAAFG